MVREALRDKTKNSRDQKWILTIFEKIRRVFVVANFVQIRDSNLAEIQRGLSIFSGYDLITSLPSGFEACFYLGTLVYETKVLEIVIINLYGHTYILIVLFLILLLFFNLFQCHIKNSSKSITKFGGTTIIKSYSCIYISIVLFLSRPFWCHSKDSSKSTDNPFCSFQIFHIILTIYQNSGSQPRLPFKEV